MTSLLESISIDANCPLMTGKLYSNRKWGRIFSIGMLSLSLSTKLISSRGPDSLPSHGGLSVFAFAFVWLNQNKAAKRKKKMTSQLNRFTYFVPTSSVFLFASFAFRSTFWLDMNAVRGAKQNLNSLHIIPTHCVQRSREPKIQPKLNGKHDSMVSRGKGTLFYVLIGVEESKNGCYFNSVWVQWCMPKNTKQRRGGKEIVFGLITCTDCTLKCTTKNV